MVLYIIDLFCGAGGFSFGASHVKNAKVAIAIDMWQKALDVHEKNHPNTIHLNYPLGGSIKKTTQEILKHLPPLKKGDKVHVHASPPCQQLSKANPKRNEDDGLSMVKWTVKMCQQACFDSFTIEQVNNKCVKELYTKLKVPFIECDFSKLGVCQSRRRLIASNNTRMLDELEKVDIPFTPLHKLVGKKVEYTSYIYNSIEHKKKYDPEKPYYTIVKEFRQYKVYTKDKEYIIDIPIASKLQGFPSHYFDSVTKCDTRQMIANAVPTQVGYVIISLLQQV